MKYIHRLLSTAFVTVLGIVFAAGVKAFQPALTWSIDLGAVFDNREGDSGITPADTYFFTTLSPEVGVSFTANDRISGGIVWTQPVGYDWDGKRVSPTLYYRREGGRWTGSVGMFPRTQLRQQLPGFIAGDSINYFQRNIRGVLVQYNGNHGFAELYLDWRQRRTNTRREAFNIVFQGEGNPRGGMFLYGGRAMMNHLALSRLSPDNEHIVDNFLVNPYVGLDIARHTALDSLTVKGGVLMTIERNRAHGQWRTPAGAWIEAVGEWRWLGVKNTLYAGGRQFPSHGELGTLLYGGEPFYSAKFYNRTDVYARIVNNRWMNLEAALDFNVTNRGFIFYQRVILRVYLDQINCPLFRKGSKNTAPDVKLRSLYL